MEPIASSHSRPYRTPKPSPAIWHQPDLLCVVTPDAPIYNNHNMTSIHQQRHLLGTAFEDFVGFCAESQLPPYRAKQVFEWVYAKGVTDFSAMTSLSKQLRRQLAEEWTILCSTVTRQQESSDGTVKLLLQWPDGATSECVLIPDDNRQTACISSQVGCPVRCIFCASGVGGLRRQLTAGEMVEQAIRIRALCEPPDSRESHLTPLANNASRAVPGPVHSRRKPTPRLNNIVFMGIGEPLANYDALLGAIRIINADWGLNIGARRITVSTVGMPAQIRRLAREDLQINLALSLHAPTDTLRRKLIPWARNVPIDELVAAGRDFFKTTGREVTIEYVLLAGVNDKTDHAHKLVKICRQMRCNVNLIRYNPVGDADLKRPRSSVAHRFAEQLRSRGINVHVRRSRGLDIDAACGQLRRSTGRKHVGAKGEK